MRPEEDRNRSKWPRNPLRAPPQTAHFESDIPLTRGRPRGSGISLLRLLRK